MHHEPTGPVCPYCNTDSQQRTGRFVHPKRPELAARLFYVCPQCDARVSCCPRTARPLGSLANAELRALRKQGHDAFDVVWRRAAPHLQRAARAGAYAWIEAELGREIHFGELREAEARRVIAWLTFMAQPPSVALLVTLGERSAAEWQGGADEWGGWDGWEWDETPGVG